MALIVELVPIERLSQDPANTRKHSDKNIEAIIASLRRFGQQKPVVATKNGIVIAGNGTLEAAKRLGWKELTVHWTTLEGFDATAYAIADNRTAELAEWDLPLLKDALQNLDNGSFPIDSTGWSEEDLEALMTAAPPENAAQHAATEDDGTMLRRLKVTLAEPTIMPVAGEVWILADRHLLIIADIATDWPSWIKHLTDRPDALLVPYPGVLAPLTMVAATRPLIMIQPEPYLAGLLLDRYVEAHGAESVKRRAND